MPAIDIKKYHEQIEYAQQIVEIIKSEMNNVTRSKDSNLKHAHTKVDIVRKSFNHQKIRNRHLTWDEVYNNEVALSIFRDYLRDAKIAEIDGPFAYILPARLPSTYTRYSKFPLERQLPPDYKKVLSIPEQEDQEEKIKQMKQGVSKKVVDRTEPSPLNHKTISTPKDESASSSKLEPLLKKEAILISEEKERGKREFSETSSSVNDDITPDSDFKKNEKKIADKRSQEYLKKIQS